MIQIENIVYNCSRCGDSCTTRVGFKNLGVPSDSHDFFYCTNGKCAVAWISYNFDYDTKEVVKAETIILTSRRR